jgi:hypothetical protein
VTRDPHGSDIGARGVVDDFLQDLVGCIGPFESQVTVGNLAIDQQGIELKALAKDAHGEVER